MRVSLCVAHSSPTVSCKMDTLVSVMALLLIDPSKNPDGWNTRVFRVTPNGHGLSIGEFDLNVVLLDACQLPWRQKKKGSSIRSCIGLIVVWRPLTSIKEGRAKIGLGVGVSNGARRKIVIQ